MNAYNVLMIFSILLAGLLAGLFYGFDCAVLPGLGKLSDSAYLTAFKSINKEILNPYFFISFVGSTVLLPVIAWLSYKYSNKTTFSLTIFSCMLYVLGVFAVTAWGNVPLNNALEKFDILKASAAEIHTQRINFELNWNRLHRIRTFAAIGSFLVLIIAIVKK